MELSVGLELNSVPDIVQALENARVEKFDFVSVPLVNPRYNRDFTALIERDEAFTRSDMLLNSSVWSSVVVAKISTWINPDSPLESVRYNSRKAFKQELAWASHLSVPAVLLPTPSTPISPNYSQLITSTLLGISHMQMWLRIPLTYSKNEGSNTWEWWNTLRTHTEHHPALSVALELTPDLPDTEILNQWLGEPLKCIILPTSIFLTNKKGYPTLSRPHQLFIDKLFRTKVQFLLKGTPHHKNKITHVDYYQYLTYLFKQKPPQTEQEIFEGPFVDYLQAPLQPLMDNLESGTYETFEKDPIKYRNYEEATFQALNDISVSQKTVIVMVVGAGRGPLVRAVLSASERSSVAVKVYAVEKNPNAVVTLRALKASFNWGDTVTIVDGDMRVWEAPEKADILVSELLGSFGDNELSPECLDGAQRFLKPQGISIPCWYTSYLAPISSAKLWNEAKAYNDLLHFETPYVVKMLNINQLAESKPLFTYVHPNKAHTSIEKIKIDNDRYGNLTFFIKESSTLHGFAGFFDACLYKDVHISINPANYSEGMFSWFPIYFPLRVPIYIPRSSTLSVQMWRLSSRTKVWYEWCVDSPSHIPIHNPNGRSYWIGL